MNSGPTAIMVSTYIERLQQAIRVMDGLSATERANFTLAKWAERSANGMIFACIAGYCGLDPWFQARGLVTTVMDANIDIGATNVFPEDYFGTEKPFYLEHYGHILSRPIGHRRVKPEDAIVALKQAVSEFEELRAKLPAQIE